MSPERVRVGLLAGLVVSALLLLAYPVEPGLSPELLFEDPVVQRIADESAKDPTSSRMVIRLSHDDGGWVSNNLTRVQSLMTLAEAVINKSGEYSLIEAGIPVERLESPFEAWQGAFESRNRSLVNATQWADVMNPINEDGWCSNASTAEEQVAFEMTSLLLPDDADMGVACPDLPGASATQPPAADELLWILWLEEDAGEFDWQSMRDWADDVSKGTEWQLEPTGSSGMFSKALMLAKEGISSILLPSVLILLAMLTLGLRDGKAALATMGGVGLVISAEFGFLGLFGYEASVLDLIALPIIMGVAVDGAFWYCRSSRDRDEVRSMLFIAMMTTVGAISMAAFSPIKAQRSMALVMVIGMVLSWAFTRFVLEEWFLRRRGERDLTPLELRPSQRYAWPAALLVLSAIILSAPPGVEVLDIEQFLPEDDPALDELEHLQSRYLLASLSSTWIVVDAVGDSPEDMDRLLDLQRQLSQHPALISLDTGIIRATITSGISDADAETLDSMVMDEDGMFARDPRLQKDGEITGVSLRFFVDGTRPDSALQFKQEAEELIADSGLEGQVGGDLPVAAELAKTFDDTRILQIFAAGLGVFLVSYLILRDPMRSLRITIGTIAVGASVDAIASLTEGRGINTAPAVLLGMGFAADYLSHASAPHSARKADEVTRWWAGATSISAFVLLAMTSFPPSRESGRLLAFSILLAVILASCLAMHGSSSQQVEDE